MEPEQPAPIQRPKWLEDIYAQMGGEGGYQLTDDDLALISQFMLMQQMQSGMGQIDLAGRNLDLQNRTLDLNEEQLGQQYAEFEFLRDQYMPWYQGDYFDFIKQQNANQLQMSNNQVAISDNDVTRSMNFGRQSMFETEAAKYGADAARYNFLVSIGATTDPRTTPQQKRQANIAGIYGDASYGY